MRSLLAAKLWFAIGASVAVNLTLHAVGPRVAGNVPASDAVGSGFAASALVFGLSAAGAFFV